MLSKKTKDSSKAPTPKSPNPKTTIKKSPAKRITSKVAEVVKRVVKRKTKVVETTPPENKISTISKVTSDKTASKNKTSKASSTQKVAFQFYAPEASCVCLVGTFNDWNPSKDKLTRDKDGIWSIYLELTPATYEYRFVVDGDWQNEQRPCKQASNPFGSTNSLIEVL